MQDQFSFWSGKHRKETGSLATPVLPWFLRSMLGSPRVLRGNHPCRGGGREGFEMNPRTGRELSVSPRQLLSLRGEDPVSAPFCKSFSSPLHNVQRKALAVRPVSMAVHWVSRGTLGIP